MLQGFTEAAAPLMAGRSGQNSEQNTKRTAEDWKVLGRAGMFGPKRTGFCPIALFRPSGCLVKKKRDQSEDTFGIVLYYHYPHTQKSHKLFRFEYI
jgi:hypothetical protein